jgi:membrane fusion protein, copper/silver efflux system
MKLAVISVIVVMAALGAGGWCWWWESRHDHTEHVNADGTITYYTCGMHPWVILPKPGDCPICHMKLEPIDPAKFSGQVAVDPVVVQNMGVRTEVVTSGPLTSSIRTVGTIEYAEPLVRDINTKVGGWIEKLHVNSVGARVKAGDVLFEVYSPELYGAQEELLLASRNVQQNSGETNRALLESARTRLSYFDVSDEQIEQILKDGKAAKTLAIRSPFDGVVVEKEALEGQKIEAGMRAYRLADLSKMWVMGTVYEYQLPFVREGQAATMSLPYIPGQTWEGKVIYVYPFLSEGTRQAKVRLEFDNSSGQLKQGMFANITLSSTLADDRVLAPRAAVIDTGKRKVAFVSLGEGKFEPREVQTGIEGEGGIIEVRQGLKPGERVVTSGQFLIDSEARIRESLAKMIKGEPAAEQQPAVAAAPANEIKVVRQADGTLEVQTCPVSGEALGSMGPPVLHQYDGQTVKFCCASCIGKFEANPQPYLEALDRAKHAAGH